MVPRRDFDALEHRRREAITLLRQQAHPAEVARPVDVSRQSVSRWQATLRTHGLRGLRRAPRAGRPSALTTADLTRVERALKAGGWKPRGYATGLWTLGRVGKLIEDQCGVRYSKPWVWHLLRRLGWSCQRPTGQARERDEAAIRRWKRVEWPRCQRSCEIPPCAIIFVDESGLSERPHQALGYRTPEQVHFGKSPTTQEYV